VRGADTYECARTTPPVRQNRKSDFYPISRNSASEGALSIPHLIFELYSKPLKKIIFDFFMPTPSAGPGAVCRLLQTRHTAEKGAITARQTKARRQEDKNPFCGHNQLEKMPPGAQTVEARVLSN
jgi:hypothetical protein